MAEPWDLSGTQDEIVLEPVVNSEMTDFDPDRALEDEDYSAQAAAMQGLDYEKMSEGMEERVEIIQEEFNNSFYPPGNSDEAFTVVRTEGRDYEAVEVRANGVFTYENGTVDNPRRRNGPNKINGQKITGQWSSELTKDLWEDLRILWSRGEGVKRPNKQENIPADRLPDPDQELNNPIDYEKSSVGDDIESDYHPLGEDLTLVQNSPFYHDSRPDYKMEDPHHRASSLSDVGKGSYSPDDNVMPLQAVVGLGRISWNDLKEKGVEPEDVSLENSIQYSE